MEKAKTFSWAKEVLMYYLKNLISTTTFSLGCGVSQAESDVSTLPYSYD